MKVRITHAALRNLADHMANHHGQSKEAYGERFDEAFRNLEDYPIMGRVGDIPGTREYAAVYPYVIIYQIVRDDDDAGHGGLLVVLNIWRGERDRSGRN